jgi:hypothetical protein
MNDPIWKRAPILKKWLSDPTALLDGLIGYGQSRVNSSVHEQVVATHVHQRQPAKKVSMGFRQRVSKLFSRFVHHSSPRANRR